MTSLKDLFTPLDKKYCNYFYYLSVICYCIFIFMILTLVGGLIFHSKKFNLYICLHSISMIMTLFLSYFVNRLMYSMCVKSL
jgi:hypothetical protein